MNLKADWATEVPAVLVLEFLVDIVMMLETVVVLVLESSKDTDSTVMGPAAVLGLESSQDIATMDSGLK